MRHGTFRSASVLFDSWRRTVNKDWPKYTYAHRMITSPSSLRRSERTPAQPNTRSSTSATPSSSFDDVTSSAAARRSG